MTGRQEMIKMAINNNRQAFHDFKYNFALLVFNTGKTGLDYMGNIGQGQRE